MSGQELGEDEKTSGSRTQRERARITYSRQEALSLSSRRELEGGQEHRAQMSKQSFLTDKSTMVQESQAGSSPPPLHVFLKLPTSYIMVCIGDDNVCATIQTQQCAFTQAFPRVGRVKCLDLKKKHSFYLELDDT